MILDMEFNDRSLNETVRLPDDPAKAFDEFFSLGLNVLKRLSQKTSTKPLLRLGRIKEPSMHELRRFARLIEERYPVKVESPFEGSDGIAGGAWLGGDLFDNHRDDALAKLCFSKGAVDLPLHSHEHSDRFILVLEGNGRYHHGLGSVHGFTGGDVEAVEVQAGDLIVFSRGLVHTFSSPSNAMTLLSWHSPYFAFDDPRQYVLPKERVCPDSSKSQTSLTP